MGNILKKMTKDSKKETIRNMRKKMRRFILTQVSDLEFKPFEHTL